MSDDDRGASAPRRRERWSTLHAVVVGLLAGALAAVLVVVVAGSSDDDGDDTVELAPVSQGLPPEQAQNVDAFLASWQRFLTGTFRVDLRFERRVTGRSDALVTPGLIVQAPPRRLVRSAGGQSVVTGDQFQRCNTGPDGQVSCTTGGTQAGYDEQVARDLAVLRTYFAGDTPLYRVSRPSAGCFELDLYKATQLPPYGQSAEFCFDADTGAMLRYQTVSLDGVDTVTAVSVRGSVSDADFST